MNIDVYFDGPCLSLLLQDKKVVHRGGVRVSRESSSKNVLEDLQKQAVEKGANALIVTYEKRTGGALWVMAGNAVLIKDAE